MNNFLMTFIFAFDCLDTFTVRNKYYKKKVDRVR